MAISNSIDLDYSNSDHIKVLEQERNVKPVSIEEVSSISQGVQADVDILMRFLNQELRKFWPTEFKKSDTPVLSIEVTDYADWLIELAAQKFRDDNWIVTLQSNPRESYKYLKFKIEKKEDKPA